LPKAISDHCVPADSTSREDGRHSAGHLLMLRCCRTDRALRELVAVRASPGARAVVLHRAVPAGSRTSRRRNDVDDGERKREGQSNLAQHGHSPQVEARSGFCGLDRGTRRLFRAGHSTGVRSVQVFVCSRRCADHINVSRRRNERAATTAGDVALLRHEFRRDRTAERLLPWHRVVPRCDCYVPRGVATTGRLIGVEGHSAGIDRCYTIDLKLMLLVCLLRRCFCCRWPPNAASR
jgi:hypothetical protein